MARKFLSGIDNSNQRIINLGDGSNPTDAVTLQQLQAAIRGLTWKAEVRAASVGNLTLSAPQTVDGVALVAGDRVLVKDQTTATANGIYTVAAGAWVRAVDADEGLEISGGIAVTVEGGTVNGDKAFVLATDGAVTIGTTSLAFVQLGGGGASYTNGNGINISGSTISAVIKAGGGLVLDATGLSIDPAVLAKRYSANIGDGSATTVTVTHNLNTFDVVPGLMTTTGTRETVDADITFPTVNTCTVTFATAPASGAYRLTLVA